MSTTFSYVIFPHHKRSDGTITVKIRMIHNSKAKYCTTSVTVTKEQLTKRMDKITDQRVVDALNVKLDEYRRIASLIDGAEYYSADMLWERIQETLRGGHTFSLDYFDYAKTKRAAMDKKTAEGYKSAFNMLERYLGKDHIDINQIDYKFLLKFRDFIEQQTSKGSRAVSYYLSCLRHIHNLAREEYNDDDTGIVRIPRQPFHKGLIPPQPVTQHRTLSLEQMHAIMSYDPHTERGRLAKDVFLLSFYLIGINTADLYYLAPESLKNGIINYNRCKTDSTRQDGAPMSVRVEPEADELLLQHKGRRLLFDFADRYSTHQNFNKNVNKGLKEIGDAIGVSDLSTYYARHTWATFARNECGVEKATVHEALNHAPDKSERITDIYVKRDWSHVWEANRKVLDYVSVAK